MAKGKFVSYLRVSTARQGRSGLGLEAQRQAVEDFLNGGKWQLVKEFVEIESGKKRHSSCAGSPAQNWSLPSSTACRAMLISSSGWKRLALILWPPTCRRPTG